MNFTDLAIFLAYIKSDEQFYHINPKEKLNHSECLKQGSESRKICFVLEALKLVLRKN